MSHISAGTIIVGIFAVLFGLVSAYAVQMHLRPDPAPEARPAETSVPPNVVPLASIDLSAGRPLTLGDIMLVRMTREELKRRNFPSDYMISPEQIIGRILREPVDRGTPFLTNDLYPEGMGPSVADRLQPGFRAVTVRIENVGAVAGFAGPGTMVDVLFRTQVNAELPETTIRLLDGVQVLALGHNMLPGTRGDGTENTVTLAVNVQQAAALKVVEGRGRLTLLMRSPNDTKPAVHSDPLTLEKLLGLPEKLEPFRAEIYVVGSHRTLTFGHQQRSSSSGAAVISVTEPEPASPQKSAVATN